MDTEKKKGRFSGILIVGIIVFILFQTISLTNNAKKEEAEAMTEATALMDEGDYQAAIRRLDIYWETHLKSEHLELVDLYVQCFESDEQYGDAAEIIISVFQEQGYEDDLDGILHTRLKGIMANLTEEEQQFIQNALDEIPDSLEEKKALEKEMKEREEAEKEAKELSKNEKEDREKLYISLGADVTNSETRGNIKKLCDEYLEKHPNSIFTDEVEGVLKQFEVINKNSSERYSIGSNIEQEYEKVMWNTSSGNCYIEYKLEYAEGLDSIVGNIQDALGDNRNYNDWVASDVIDFYGTAVPGDTVYIIRTQRMFPKEGVYSFDCLVYDGTKRLQRSGGFEFTADVYREVSYAYIDEVCAQYEDYQKAEANIENAYYNLEQLNIQIFVTHGNYSLWTNIVYDCPVIEMGLNLKKLSNLHGLKMVKL